MIFPFSPSPLSSLFLLLPFFFHKSMFFPYISTHNFINCDIPSPSVSFLFLLWVLTGKIVLGSCKQPTKTSTYTHHHFPLILFHFSIKIPKC
ncbi:hypothetical protein V6Z11_A06G129600 [Gossypium hirsutum]